MLIGASGKVEQADIATSSGNDLLDAAAVEAVMGVRCAPAKEPKTGQIVAVRAMQSILFDLDTLKRSDK